MSRLLLTLPIALFVVAINIETAKAHQGKLRFEVTEATIAETQRAIREGRSTCSAIVSGYLARIRAYDAQLNSIVTLNPNALADAAACDSNFATTHKLPALGGIAVLIKDNYDTQGIQTTGGSLAMKGFVPEHDATLVAKLRAAGAIVLGKTNMAEWAFSPYLTESSIHGTTHNAYDLSRVPAGSSGGTAAAVAASLAELGLGTDTGNSIRGPSSHNDLVGIRPTIGLTSRAGIIPLFANNDVGGPMARTVADAAALLTVLAGADPADPITSLAVNHASVDYSYFLDRHGLRGARIGVFREYFDTANTDAEVKAVTEQALRQLVNEGAVLIDPFKIPEEASLQKDLWCGDFQADLNGYLAKHPNAPYRDLASIVASGLYLPANEKQMKEAIAPPKNGQRRLNCPDVYHDPPKVAFRNALIEAMIRNHLDAIVYPTWSNAPRKIGDMTSPAGDNSQVLSPQTGFPAITVPMGFTHGNLPAGLTFLGREFSEATLIRFAYDFEQTVKQRRTPALFPPLPSAKQ